MNEETRGEEPCSPNGFGLCMTHPTCEHVKNSLREAQSSIADKQREIVARGEILDAIASNVGWEGNCWSSAAEIDWRGRLRDFASDDEQHTIKRAQWKLDRGNGITLYAHGGFFTAYFDDAAELWGQADDTLPMYHVMVKQTTHRTVIHPLHLVAWCEHFAEICLPVQILKGEFDE